MLGVASLSCKAEANVPQCSGYEAKVVSGRWASNRGAALTELILVHRGKNHYINDHHAYPKGNPSMYLITKYIIIAFKSCLFWINVKGEVLGAKGSQRSLITCN
jgi:hypothetical protein